MKTSSSMKFKRSKLSPKSSLFFVLIFLFFITFNSGIISNSLTLIADEIFLALSFCIILYSFVKDLTIKKIKKIYFVLLIYQIINFFFSMFSLKLWLVMPQSLINLKVFLVSLATLLVWENTTLNKKLVINIYYLFVGFFLFGIIVNLALQEHWHMLIGNTEKISYRYGFIRPVGWLGHSAQNGYFFAITFLTLYLLHSKTLILQVSYFVKKFFIFTIVDFLIAFPLSVRKGMMMIIPFGFTTLTLLKGRKKFLFSILAVFFLIIFLFTIRNTQMFEDTLMNFSQMTTAEDNSYIRGLMIFHGLNLFIDFFPLGVGNATFGTVLSQYNTLEVYDYVNLPLDRIYYNSGRLEGVYDSGMFSMLAENGFTGMLLIICFIFLNLIEKD